MTVSFIDYDPQQSKWITTAAMERFSTPNLVGEFGVFLSFWMNYFFGYASWIFPIVAIWSSFALFTKRIHLFSKWRYSVMAVALITTSGLLDLAYHNVFNPKSINPNTFPYGPGGILGYFVFTRLFNENLGIFGSSFILGTTSLCSLILCLSLASNPNQALEFFYRTFIPWLINLPARLVKYIYNLILDYRKEAEEQPKPEIIKASVETKPASLPTEEKTIFSKITQSITEPLKIIKSETVKKASVPLPKSKGDYKFPSFDILMEATEEYDISEEEHQQTAEKLVQTLAEFGVNVTPGEIHTGPVITRYEVTPAPGVRVEKILNLDKNIALALKAHSVRILAPVPGKGSVGIEIPNSTPSPVYLRDILESAAWSEGRHEIPIVLGKEVTGRPMVYDLTKMPHLLIAGSTGSGKTVCINTIIASLLYHSSPQDLRFLMVDPKIVEMQLYNDLPHMLIPVVTEAKKVPGALKWLISEMETRYQIFAKSNVRNIAGFNAKILKDKNEKEKAKELEAELSAEERAAVSSIEVPRDVDLEIPTEKLPYIVCIVDELADLMMVAPADIESSITRLAQLARAAGIHLILATQRPSVNVVTGVIKANLPCRIAFKVASKVDSRTILDGMGADQLIGRGDMLFIPPGTSTLVRAQGAYLSDPEINSIIEELKVNGPPDYADDVQREIDASDGNTEELEAGNWDDELVPAAIQVLRNSNRASTSLLQRRLKIGYNRAARIMEILEQEGYVGPENGQNPREIIREMDGV